MFAHKQDFGLTCPGQPLLLLLTPVKFLKSLEMLEKNIFVSLGWMRRYEDAPTWLYLAENIQASSSCYCRMQPWLSLCFMSVSLASLCLALFLASFDSSLYEFFQLTIKWRVLRIIIESQNHRIVGLGRDLCGSSSPTPLPKQGHLTAGCTGPCPGRSWISPEKKTPQPLWAAWSSALSPSEGRSSFSCSDGTSCASVSAHCPLSCRWALLKRVWPHPPDTHPSDICRHF